MIKVYFENGRIDKAVVKNHLRSVTNLSLLMCYITIVP